MFKKIPRLKIITSHLVCILSCSIIFISCYTTKNIEGSFIENYRGKVKKVINVSYEGSSPRNDTLTSKIGFKTVETFDRDGKPLEIVFYLDNERPPYEGWKFIYDSLGRKTQTIIWEEQGADTTIKQHDIETKGKRGAALLFPGHFTQNNIDVHNSCLNVFGYAATGKGKKTQAMIIDKRGNPLELIQLDTSGNIESRTINQLDKKGNVLKTERYRNGKLWHRTISTYDKYGNIIEQTEDNIEKNTHKYSQYRYDYDRKKNWIRKYLIKDGSEQHFEEQFFEYYQKK